MWATNSKSLIISLFRWPVCVSRENLAGKLIFFAVRMEDIAIDSKYRKENKSTEEQLEATSYVYSIDQAERLIANFETKSFVKFASYKADKNFGNDGKLTD